VAYLDPPKDPSGVLGWLDRRTPYFWLYLFFTLSISAIVFKDPAELLRPYSFNLHMRAAPYVWSPQCPSRAFKEGDWIELGCAREEYRFKDASVKLLSYGRSKTPYYRIGNDLLPLSCGSEGCIVYQIMKGAYYQ
jgi:hypothetical protein